MDITRVFEQHHEGLFRYLCRYAGDPELAEDIAQEAFIKIAAKPPPESASVKVWLYQLGTNLIRDHLRTQRRRFALLQAKGHEVHTGTPAPDPSVQAELAELKARLKVALAELSEKERTILLMREEGFTHREIADAVGTTTKSVGTMFARALRKLTDKMVLERESAHE